MASSGADKLLGKVALITGGSRGIGRAVASVYAREGAHVFICGRNAQDVERTIGEIRRSRGQIDGCAGDIGSAADVERIVKTAIARFSTIDVLVNNAGILGPRATIAEYPIDAWQEVIRINLSGIFLMIREVLPIMLVKHSGSIINVTSGVGRRGRAQWGAYAASKGGLELLTQVLAEELKGAGVRVNAVNPAATRTAMRAEANPTEDPETLPTPDEIVPIFLYLAADESGSISGQSLDARDWIGRDD